MTTQPHTDTPTEANRNCSHYVSLNRLLQLYALRLLKK